MHVLVAQKICVCYAKELLETKRPCQTTNLIMLHYVGFCINTF
jgi:hypothetical protein